MAELIKKITAEDIAQYGVVAAPDKLEGDPGQNKAIFDRLVRELVANAVNQAIDVVNGISPQIEEWAEAEAQRILNEENRKTAEDERDSAEDAREENETGRVNAETMRATNEETRKTAETQRAAAETVRQSNEQARKTAETQRAGAEANRQTNEQTRQNQEQARQTAEALRATAEQERKTAETQRAAAETTRQTNEQTRQSNEQVRKTAEAQREANEQNRKDSFVEEIDQAKSWAVGGTGKRPGEDTNNAKYWSEQAKANVGGDFATNARVDEVEEEVGRVAQSVSDLETQVEQDVGQAVNNINQTLNTRVQPINLGGTNASTADQARQNLGAAAVRTMTKAEYEALATIDPTIFYALADAEGDGAKIEVISYVGTGTNGSANPTSVTVDFPIKVAEILEVDGVQPLSPTSSTSVVKLTMNALTLTTSYVEGAGLTPSGTSRSSWGKRSEDGKTFSWYNTTGATYQFNKSGSVYAILIIG